MMLKHRPRAGDVLMVADILWPPDYIDGDPIMCMICQEPVHPDHLLVSAGVEVPV